MHLRARVWMAVLAAGLLTGGTMPAARAQTAPGKAAVSDQAAQPAAGATFEELLARRDALGEQLRKIQADFLKTQDPAVRQKLQQDYAKIVDDFRKQTVPQMFKLALPLYEKDEKHKDARDVVFGYVNDLFVDNRYAEVIKVCDPLLKTRRHPALLNFGGVSHFAVHDFDQAYALLKDAEKLRGEEDGAIFEELGARYIGECKNYTEWWKAEQALRAKEAKLPKDQALPRVLFKTTRGDIVLELFEDQAPNTVANFVSLVEKKKYDGIAFHRVIPNFMAQGGDPLTLDGNPANDGTGGPGYHIRCECYRPDARKHFQGSLSMAHAGKDTGGSQFFLTHLPTAHLNANAERQSGHTVFGRVAQGMDVAAALRVGDKILSATVLHKRNHKYEPEKLPE